MTTPTPSRVVLYTLTEQNASDINKRREDAKRHIQEHRDVADGSQIHVGNKAKAGDVLPMTIVRAWGNQPTSSVNGQVMLDGNDTLWVTSVACGEKPGTFAWPVRS